MRGVSSVASSCPRREVRYKLLETGAPSPVLEKDASDSEVAVLRQRLRVQARTVEELRTQLVDSQREAQAALAATSSAGAAALRRANVTIWKLRRSLDESNAAGQTLRDENARLSTLVANANRVVVSARQSCRRGEGRDCAQNDIPAPKMQVAPTGGFRRANVISKSAAPSLSVSSPSGSIILSDADSTAQLRSAEARISQLEAQIRDLSMLHEALMTDVKKSASLLPPREAREFKEASASTICIAQSEANLAPLSLADELMASTQSTLVEPRELKDAAQQVGTSFCSLLATEMQTEPMDLLLSAEQLLAASRARLVAGAEFLNVHPRMLLNASNSQTFYWCTIKCGNKITLHRWSKLALTLFPCLKVVRTVAVVATSINCRGRLEIYTKSRSRMPSLLLEGPEAIAWHFAIQCVLAES